MRIGVLILLLPETDEEIAEVIKKRLTKAITKEFLRCGLHLSVSIEQITPPRQQPQKRRIAERDDSNNGPVGRGRIVGPTRSYLGVPFGLFHIAA